MDDEQKEVGRRIDDVCNFELVTPESETNYLLDFLRMVRLTSEREGKERVGSSIFGKGMAEYRWGNTVANLEEEQAYGGKQGFPTDRRPCSYQRTLMVGTNDSSFDNMIGDYQLTMKERGLVRDLLRTWSDLFVDDPVVMPVTDLVIHTIPTYGHIKPHRAKEKLYTPREVKWQQENIPRLLKAGVISYCDSPWSAQTKHPVKKDGTLRMVNIFCPVNAATIKSNYPMRRIEPILNSLSQYRYQAGPKFQADAVNGYYAVPLWPEHAYKTAFSCTMGQFCYNVMGQGLTGAPHTYSRLKDIAMGYVPAPCEEEPIHGETNGGMVSYEYFLDDDYGAAVDFETLFKFLHEKYFPRISWARLTLKPKKTKFFTKDIEILGHEIKGCERKELLGSETRENIKGVGLKPSVDKISKFANFPIPTNEKEVDQFLYMTTYLKRYIPGRAEHAKILKESIKWEVKLNHVTGKKERVKTGWYWGEKQQRSFDHIRDSVSLNTCVGGDPDIQYHLTCDASQAGIGAVLFQLRDVPPGTIMTRKTFERACIVMFISQKLSDTEQRYQNTEREALAVLRGLEEARWLIVGSKFPVMVYTDHAALLSVLKGNTRKGGGTYQGRVSSWLMRLAEYDIQYHHLPGSGNGLADGLSRVTALMDPPRRECDDWENVANVEIDGRETNEKETGKQVEEGVKKGDLERWKRWLEDTWYRDILIYKLTGSLKEGEKRNRQVRRESVRYYLLEEAGEPQLIYGESTGEHSKCVLKTGVTKILDRYHDCHGHFGKDMTLRLLKGRYFWPTRSRDVAEYVKSCDSCQRFGPLRGSQQTGS